MGDFSRGGVHKTDGFRIFFIASEKLSARGVYFGKYGILFWTSHQKKNTKNLSFWFAKLNGKKKTFILVTLNFQKTILKFSLLSVALYYAMNMKKYTFWAECGLTPRTRCPLPRPYIKRGPFPSWDRSLSLRIMTCRVLVLSREKHSKRAIVILYGFMGKLI